MLRVDLKRTPGQQDAVCFVCSGDVSLRGIEAQLCINDEQVGLLCERCLKGDDAQFSSTLRKRAKHIRGEAQQLMDKADSLDVMAAAGVELPSWECYMREMRRLDEELEVRLSSIMKDIENESHT